MSENKISPGCCNVEAIVSFDERGQLVIPKDVRKKFNLNAGDKFALISCSTDIGENSEATTCCFTLMKTGQLEDMVKQSLGPMFSEIFNK